MAPLSRVPESGRAESRVDGGAMKTSGVGTERTMVGHRGPRSGEGRGGAAVVDYGKS
jgi:hypothetical protein